MPSSDVKITTCWRACPRAASRGARSPCGRAAELLGVARPSDRLEPHLRRRSAAGAGVPRRLVGDVRVRRRLPTRSAHDVRIRLRLEREVRRGRRQHAEPRSRPRMNVVTSPSRYSSSGTSAAWSVVPSWASKPTRSYASGRCRPIGAVGQPGRRVMRGSEVLADRRAVPASRTHRPSVSSCGTRLVSKPRAPMCSQRPLARQQADANGWHREIGRAAVNAARVADSRPRPASANFRKTAGCRRRYERTVRFRRLRSSQDVCTGRWRGRLRSPYPPYRGGRAGRAPAWSEGGLPGGG